MLSDVPGVRVGHWTNDEARTGCTVVLLPRRAVASGEIRGGAPATREFGLLDPWRMIPAIDAVVLSGGSAFGLATADGVVRWLEEQGRGFTTATANVPIVVGMSLYDLGVGDPSVRPGPAEGRLAAEAAGPDPDPDPDPDPADLTDPAAAGAPPTTDPAATPAHRAVNLGLIGAGTGGTVGKWGGPDTTRPGGLVTATIRAGEVVVSALLAVNAYGWLDDGTSVADPGPPVRPTPADDDTAADADAEGDLGAVAPTNTTIGVVVTNATVDKVGCYLLAQSAHDGLARSLVPAHTAADGDAFVAVATGGVEADLMHLRLLAQHAVTRAVRTLL